MNRLNTETGTIKGTIKKLAVFAAMLFVMTLVSGVLVFADTYGDFEYSVNGSEVTITKYTGEGGNVVIPDTIAGINVTVIGEDAFSNAKLTNITLPANLIKIEGWAFYNCDELISLELPNSVTSIEQGAFTNCYKLTTLNIPSGVTEIGSTSIDSVNPFDSCTSLTNITVAEENTKYTSKISGVECNGIFGKENKKLYVGCKNTSIPEGVTAIGYDAFSGCYGLTELVIPSTVTSIDGFAFKECAGLTSLHIPSGVVIIASDAFIGCSSLTDITVAEENTEYTSKIGGVERKGIFGKDDNVLYVGCRNTSVPEGVTGIGGKAFNMCYELKSLELPSTLTSIGSYAFSQCYNLTSLTIPDNVTSIGSVAFGWCESLTSLTIPSGVTTIGGSAITDCAGLTTVDNKSNVEIELPAVDGYVWKDESGTVITKIKNGVATRVDDESGNGGNTGSIDETEDNDTSDTANPISLDQDIYGEISKGGSSGDHDWFSFEVPDQSVRPGSFRVCFYSVDGEATYWRYEITDDNIHTVYDTGSTFKDAEKISPNFGFKSRTMYVHVYTGLFNKDKNHYKIRVEYTEDNAYEAEYNDSIDDANSLPVGQKKQGTIHKNKAGAADTDYYEVNIDNKGSYTLHFEQKNGDLTLGGWKVFLLNEDSGEVAKFTARTAGDTTSGEKNLEAGKYYVKVEKNGDNAYNLPYYVSVTGSGENGGESGEESGGETGGNDNFDKTLLDEGGRIDESGSAKGDWIEFDVPDQSVDPGYFNIVFKSVNGEGSIWDYELTDKDKSTVYDTGSFKDARKESPNFGFTGQKMYVHVWIASGGLNKNNNDYNILVRYTKDTDYEAEYNDSPATANSLAAGKKKQGTIHKNKTGAADCDFYKLDLSADSEYTPHLYHNNGDKSGGWKVTLLDKDNSEICNFTAKKSGDTAGEIEYLSAGIYYLKVEKATGWTGSEIFNLPYFVYLGEGDSYTDPVTVQIGEYSISYNRIVTFFGKTKKLKNEAEIEKVFGEIKILWQGESYKATSIKISKKNGNNYIRILTTSKSDKSFNKGLKNLTKGTSGLQFTIKPLKITSTNAKTLVNVKKNKSGKVKSVIVTTKGPKEYKASKKNDYSVNGTTITFKGENLEGSCSF